MNMTYAKEVDYVIFGLTLVISFVIGVFYAYRGRKSTSKDEYFAANRNVNVFAAACSALASAFPGSVLIAFPNDAYFRGPGLWYGVVIANVLESITLPIVFVPIFHRLKLINVYDYLELRFDKRVKYYAAFVQVMYTMFTMAVNVYIPSLAMAVITGISINWSIVIVGGTCVVYTAIGGMRAVVWNDVFQTLVILSGTVAFFVIGLNVVGGVRNVIDVTNAAGRGIAIDLTFDLKLPYTLWSALIGVYLNALTRSAVGQYNAQRYLIVERVSEARITAATGQLCSASLLVLYIFGGLMMYTFYAGCDPLTTGVIERDDQIFPLFLAELFQGYPGFTGLMIAAVFSSSLSTASSGINSQALMTHAEIGKWVLKDPSPKQTIVFIKLLTAFIGCFILGIAFLGTYIGGIIDAIITWSGILIGPILGVFILGMFSRGANSTGALVGMIVSTLVGIWLKLGNTFYPKLPSIRPPLYVNECNTTVWVDEMLTTNNPTMITPLATEGDDIPPSVYQLSSSYYTTLACCVTWIVAVVVSYCTRPDTETKMNDELLFFRKKIFSMKNNQSTNVEKSKEDLTEMTDVAKEVKISD